MDFFNKYQALKQSIPTPALIVSNNQNCHYVDYTHHSKDCYYSTQLFNSEFGLHSYAALGKHYCDCQYTVFVNFCYECTDCFSCSTCTYCQICTNCTDCHFCDSCVNCTDCFGCTTLSHKKYCLFNQQLTKAEYLKQLKTLKSQPPQKHLSKLNQLIQATPRPASLQRQNINCPYGDNLNNSKNVYWGFDTYYLEDSGYIYQGGIAKNCWDMTFGGGSLQGLENPQDATKGQPTELCYELTGAGACYNCTHLEQGNSCTNCHYGAYLRNCTDCWGCVGLTNKKYCVLNNQLTKDQYLDAVKLIKQDLAWPQY